MQGEVYVTVEANETGAQGRALVSGDNGRILGVGLIRAEFLETDGRLENLMNHLQ